MIDSYPQHITDSARAVFDQAQKFNTRYQDYNMKLQPDGSISNCTAELRKHLNKKLRKLSLEQKLLWLYDRAFEYGYLVSDVHAQVEALANITFVNWYSAAMFYFDIKIHSVDSIFNYAQAVGRKYIILHPTYNINYTIPQTLKPHLHVITADSKPRLSLQDLDVNKINVCYFKSSSSVQLITVSLRLKKLIEQEGLESETLLLSNATVPNTKMKVLIIK
jgi:hypothetical protein